ncbi:MAG TPA: hypothetical protein VLI90_11270 [Tepidisphaeraceae bacterium]|nr:hypothetical protein [Tepidisphaeraceae bacterium]
MPSLNLSRPLAVVVTLLLLSGATPTARANFVLLSHHLTVDRTADTASFDLVFNQKPDLHSVDSDGRAINSFQIEFAGDHALDGLPYPQNLTAVIRGEEIHIADAVRIRAPIGDGGPNSGGWGPVIDSEPFTVDQNKVSFSTSIEDLGLRGRTFNYSVYSLESGSLTAIEEVHVVPLPPAVEMFVPAGLILMIAARLHVRAEKRAK